MIFKICGLLVLIQLITWIDCKCTADDYDRADKAFLGLTVYGDPEFIWPKDIEMMETRCKIFAKQQAEVKKFYDNCLNAFSKQTVGMLLRGVKKELKKYCSRDNYAATIIANQCSRASMQSNKVCMQKFVSNLKRIANAPLDERFKYICCSVYSFQDCIKTSMQSAGKKCKTESIDLFYSMVKGYTRDIRQLICGGVEKGLSVCPDAQKKLSKMPESDIKSESVLPAYVWITKDF